MCRGCRVEELVAVALHEDTLYIAKCSDWPSMAQLGTILAENREVRGDPNSQQDQLLHADLQEEVFNPW